MLASCAAAAQALIEPFDRADVQCALAEILARDVDLGLLAGAAERDVGVLTVGLPAAGEEALVWVDRRCSRRSTR
jgi:hypothetical protein